ncbi:SDR family oxidoreductase [Streptomyces sp. NPDC002514]|uniref:SDR family oxidoreductase n=1 Tax=Streptomyces sp. NPDC001270 TaxID=3364554 RepID=UPI0036C1EE04
MTSEHTTTPAGLRTAESDGVARPLTGRVAVVTGASSGIGAATAGRLAAAGAAVALLGRRADRLNELADRLRATATGTDRPRDTATGTVLPLAVDLTDPEAVQAAARTVGSRLGRVDLVVAGAGAMLGAPFADARTEEWDRMIDVNLRGLLHTARVFTDDLLAAAADGRPADLVHVGSVAGHSLYPNWSVYCATKAAVAHLTRNLRAELGPRGVRVKNVEPGVTVTELGSDMQDGDMRATLVRMRTDLRPLGAEDIAEAIAFAVSAPPHVNIAELIVVPVQQG